MLLLRKSDEIEYEFVKEFNVMLNKMDILINDEVNEIRFITFKSLVINDML